MVAIDKEETTEILENAFILTKNVKVHQDLCRQVVALALQQNTQLSKHSGWLAIVEELRISIQEWSDLTPLESFLKCDIISAKLAALRSVVSDFQGKPVNRNYDKVILSDARSLIPPLLAIFRSPDAIEHLDALPNAHCDAAVSLFQRILSALPLEPSPLRDLVSSTLSHMQSKKEGLDMGFEVPELTLDIVITSPEVTVEEPSGYTMIGNSAKHGSVTLKVLKSLTYRGPRCHQVLRRELKQRLGLQHPNLLPFYGTCSTRFGTALVSPYMPNGTASAHLSNNSAINALEILVGAADGLSYLHSCWPAIAHGDIRGANILISSTGAAILANHGLVALQTHDHTNELGHDMRAHGRLAISLINPESIRWTAPEIVCDEDDLERNVASRKEESVVAYWSHGQVNLSTGHDALIEVVTTMSDVWSFGMTIYELLTGRVPYQQHSRNETVAMAISINELPLPPTSSSEVRSEWQPELWGLMQECWRMDRRKRPVMEAVTKKLRGILGKSAIMRDSVGPRRACPTDSSGELSRSQSLSNMAEQSGPSASSPQRVPKPLARKPSHPALLRLNTTIKSRTTSPVSPSSTSPTSSIRLHTTSPTSALSMSSSRSLIRGMPPNQATPRRSPRTEFSPDWGILKEVMEQERMVVSGSSNTLIGANDEAERGWDQMSLTQRRTFLYNRKIQNTEDSVSAASSPRLPTVDRPSPIIDTNDIHTVPMLPSEPPPTTTAISPTSSLPESANSSLTSDYLPPRPRTSAPISVGSDNSRTTFAEAVVSRLRGESFDLMDEDEDEGTLNGHTPLGDDPRPPIHASLMDTIDGVVPPSYYTTDLMSEAFRSVSSLPTVNSGGPVPYDVSSPSSESSTAIFPPPFPPGLDRPQKKPDKSPSPADFQACQISLDRLLEEGGKYIKTVPESEILGIIEEVDITFLETYDGVRSTHERFLQSLQPLLPILDLGGIRKLFEAWEEAARVMPPVYQNYGDGLSNLDVVLANCSEGSICHTLLQKDDIHAQLSALLRGPYAQLERYLYTMQDVFTSLEPYPAFHQIVSFRQILSDWKILVSRAQLWAWQSLAGLNPLISFTKEEICPRASPVEEEGAARCNSRFRIINDQKDICNQMHDAQKRFEKLISDDQELAALCDSQRLLLELYVEVLDELYLLQRNHHPELPPITSVFLNAIERWEDGYMQHGRVIEAYLKKHGTTNPLLDRDLQVILQLPSSYVRNLLKNFRDLFDVTPDHHFDIELIIRLLPAIEHLSDISSHACWTNGVTKEIQDLRGMLSWGEIEDRSAGLDNNSRHLLHSGVLYYPIDPSGSRSSIEDRGTSIEVFVALLDNCLIICDPQARLGIRRLRVRAVVPLMDIHIPDVEASRMSQQQIFLLDTIDGKKVAVPLMLRYRDVATATAGAGSRDTSAVTVREGDEAESQYPKEMLLLASSTRESAAWRERLVIAKTRLKEEPVVKPTSKNMFKLTPLAGLTFMPTSSAVLCAAGRRNLILCAGGNRGGVFIQDENDTTLTFMHSVDVRQSFVIESMNLALFLVGKALWSMKTEELTTSVPPTPTVIKNNVSFFRVGFQRGQLLLVVASETSKSTILKWYNPVSRMSRRSMVFSPGIFNRSSKSFKSMGEHELLCKIHDLNIMDDSIIVMGVSGFQLIIMDQGPRVKVEDLPRLPVGASSAAAQRCQTSKALGAVRSGAETLLCYSDFGIYVNAQGEITGRLMDWTNSRITNVVFGAPYLFLIAENCIEVRLIENCRKLETLEGNGFQLVRGVMQGRMQSHLRPIGHLEEFPASDTNEYAVEPDSGLLHLAVPLAEPASGFELLELQMEVLDLSA